VLRKNVSLVTRVKNTILKKKKVQDPGSIIWQQFFGKRDDVSLTELQLIYKKGCSFGRSGLLKVFSSEEMLNHLESNCTDGERFGPEMTNPTIMWWLSLPADKIRFDIALYRSMYRCMNNSISEKLGLSQEDLDLFWHCKKYTTLIKVNGRNKIVLKNSLKGLDLETFRYLYAKGERDLFFNDEFVNIIAGGLREKAGSRIREIAKWWFSLPFDENKKYFVEAFNKMVVCDARMVLGMKLGFTGSKERLYIHTFGDIKAVYDKEKDEILLLYKNTLNWREDVIDIAFKKQLVEPSIQFIEYNQDKKEKDDENKPPAGFNPLWN